MKCKISLIALLGVIVLTVLEVMPGCASDLSSNQVSTTGSPAAPPTTNALSTGETVTVPPTAVPPPPTDVPHLSITFYPSSTVPGFLSAGEKEKVIQIAVNCPAAQQWLQGRTDYRTGSVDWYAISFQDGKPGSWSIVRPEDSRVSTALLTPPVLFYPGVTISVGEDTIYLMQIAVDLDAGTTVMVEGPLPSLDSPSRFRGMKKPPESPKMPPAENQVITTIAVNQSITAHGITLSLQQIVVTGGGFSFNVLYTPPGYDPADGIPEGIPGAMAEYSLDDGPTIELASPPPFSLDDKGIEWSWISDTRISHEARELTIRITSVGKQSGPWEFRVQLNQS
jgi:hypothetical protein